MTAMQGYMSMLSMHVCALTENTERNTRQTLHCVPKKGILFAVPLHRPVVQSSGLKPVGFHSM